MSRTLVLLTLVLVASSAAGQTPDHLKCYRIKDPQTKTTYIADLNGLNPEPGCIIRVPAKLACVPASKTNVAPTPPGGGGSGTPNSFFCYKVKCPKATLPTLLGADQFGSRTVTPSAAKLVCAPLAGPPTTTTTPDTSTTTTTSTSTTMAICGVGPLCGNGTTNLGEVCDGIDLPRPGGLGGQATCADFMDDTGAGVPFDAGLGTLSCSPTCFSFDTSQCQRCGNNIQEGSEPCDGFDLGCASCQSLGFTSGTLACSGCTFDTGSCQP